MHQKEFWAWAEEKNLIKYIEKYHPYFEKVLSDCLSYGREKVLIISDYGQGENLVAPIFAGCYLKALKGKNVNLMMQGIKSKNQQADKEVIEALDKLPKKNLILMCLSNMLGKLGVLGKSYRKFARSRKHKFVSTTGFGSLNLEQLDNIISSLDVDYVSIRNKGIQLKEILDKAKEIKIKTKAGTDLVLSVDGMNATMSVGIFNQPGLGGNIPTGEVFIPPRIRSVEGVLVVDVSVRHREGTLLVKEPLVLTIKEGKVTKLEGEGANLVEETLAEAEKKAQFPERVRLVGELGIGINPGAKIVGATIIDEKVLGTAHIAIGSNYWYGGQIKTIIHLDQVFKDPEIFVDGKKLTV